MIKHGPDNSVIWGNSENINSLGILPPVIQSGHYSRPPNNAITSAATLTGIERPVRLRHCGSPCAQRGEHSPLARRRFKDNGARHARADQYTFRHFVDMNTHGDALG